MARSRILILLFLVAITGGAAAAGLATGGESGAPSATPTALPTPTFTVPEPEITTEQPAPPVVIGPDMRRREIRASGLSYAVPKTLTLMNPKTYASDPAVQELLRERAGNLGLDPDVISQAVANVDAMLIGTTPELQYVEILINHGASRALPNPQAIQAQARALDAEFIDFKYRPTPVGFGCVAKIDPSYGGHSTTAIFQTSSGASSITMITLGPPQFSDRLMNTILSTLEDTGSDDPGTV